MSSSPGFFSRLGSEIKRGTTSVGNIFSGKRSRNMAAEEVVREEERKVAKAERIRQEAINYEKAQLAKGLIKFEKRTRTESRADQQGQGASSSYMEEVWGTAEDVAKEEKHEALYQEYKTLKAKGFDKMTREEKDRYLVLSNYPYSMHIFGGRRSKTKRSKKSARKSKRKTRR